MRHILKPPTGKHFLIPSAQPVPVLRAPLRPGDDPRRDAAARHPHRHRRRRRRRVPQLLHLDVRTPARRRRQVSWLVRNRLLAFWI